jgi:hypothetical protein
LNSLNGSTSVDGRHRPAAGPAPLQGRGYSAVELLVGVPQTVSVAAGAMLVAVVDYRLLLLVAAAVVAGAGAWLLARAAQGVSASH